MTSRPIYLRPSWLPSVKQVALWLCMMALPIHAMAQSKKTHKKLHGLLLSADSLRLQLRQSADKGRMLQWGDSILMARLAKSKMSPRKKARIMKHYQKIQRRLHLYDRKLFRGDSLLAARYSKLTFDTAYITRPDTRWTVKFRENVSGAGIKTAAVNGNGVSHSTKLRSDLRGTISIAVAYRGVAAGLAMNPAKLVGKNKDFEFNLNSYGNRYGFDIVYISSNTFHGQHYIGNTRHDIDKGLVSQNAINLNAYYAFNYRRFSFPAAFSQSYIQKRSAGSWMIGASFDGSKTVVKADDATADAQDGGAGGMMLQPMTIRLNELAIGGGYGYNLVMGSHLLFHLSALPTFTVYSHDYTQIAKEATDGNAGEETTSTRNSMKYHFPSVIVTGRGAALYSWRNKFAGATMVYNFSVAGDEKHLQLKRNKWRLRMFFGFRF